MVIKLKMNKQENNIILWIYLNKIKLRDFEQFITQTTLILSKISKFQKCEFLLTRIILLG